MEKEQNWPNSRENENKNGTQNPSVEPREAALRDFISQCENNVSDPQVHIPQVSTETVGRAKQVPSKRQPAKKQSVIKGYKLAYSEDKKEELELVTKIATEQIEGVKADKNFLTYDYGSGNNCVIDITDAMKKGIAILTPVVNRKHGKDAMFTGISMGLHGSQQMGLVITKAMADAAGMAVERFHSDKSHTPITDLSLVMINGNGRIEHMMELEEKDRPQFYATFIEPDSLGYYNPCKAMEVINTERQQWKTQDMVLKRLLEDGKDAHKGWNLLLKLIKDGYMYQAACQTITLDTDRIKQKDVLNGNPNEIFSDYKYAIRIHEAFVGQFGEGEDKTLKTKEFTKEISTLWKKLVRVKGSDWATEELINFIKSLDNDKVVEIRCAKSERNGRKKDEIRKAILNEQFDLFCAKKGIKFD